MKNIDREKLRKILDKYSPIVSGKTGAAGKALRAVNRVAEFLTNAGGAVSQYPLGLGFKNRAGQAVTDCKAVIPQTFARMEKKLSKSFNAAAAEKASSMTREKFLKLADEVKTDSRVLGRHCTVVAQQFGMAVDKYRFIVSERKMPDGSKIATTLEEGVAQIREKLEHRPRIRGVIKRQPPHPRQVEIRT